MKFSADALYKFNSAALQPGGQSDLDKFANELKGTTYEHINVYGYTDRLGSDEYNQKLSQQRADSVKDYLIDKDGLDASKIDTHGMGKADPVTSESECPGKKSPKLIACLQPDRRVEIEVNGLKKP